MKYKQVVVIGPGDDFKHEKEAYEIGRYIAKKGWALVTGGRGGIMEAASRGACEGKGIVVGILPGNTIDGANKYCNVVIPTGIGDARNQVNVLSGDVIISINGKAGTLSEMAFAWKFGKPIILCKFTGGWSEKISSSPIDDRKGTVVYVADSTEDVFNYLDMLLGPNPPAPQG